MAENTRLILMDKKDRNESGSKRAAIEETNSAFRRAHGDGKLKVRGLVRCSLVIGLKIIAHNFHQIVRFFQGNTRQNTTKLPIHVKGYLRPFRGTNGLR